MIFAIIMSGLALLAATAGLTIAIGNEKRSKKRNAALIQYIDQTAQKNANKAAIAAGAYTDEEVKKVRSDMVDLTKRTKDLEDGITPNYEQAKAAANAVNDFSKGISNILGFDPMEALRAERQKNERGDVNDV